MKQLTLTTLLLTGLFSAGAFADPVYIDVGAATTQAPGNAGDTNDANTFTSVFSQMQMFADTTTTQYDTDASGTTNTGDIFLDSGSATVTDLLPPGGDDEGISFFSEITVNWSGLSGALTSDLTPIGPFGDVSQTLAYDTTNTTFDFYFHGDGSGPNSDFGFDVGEADNTGFTDGELVLSLLITGGSGTNTFNSFGDFVSGSSVLSGEVTYALDDFWWFDDGDSVPGVGSDEDFESLLGLAVPITLLASIDQNTDQVVTDFSGSGTPGPAGFGDELLKVHSTHDGSIDFSQAQVEVPAPQTLLLIGFGLLMFPWMRRRKNLIQSMRKQK